MQILPDFVQLDAVDSTNNYIAKAIDEGNYVAGTAILAHFQKEGRGQRGRFWQSESGKNLTFSFALSIDKLPRHQQFLLSKCMATGLSRFITETIKNEAFIKWPNDVLVNGRKISGMLIETKSGGQAMAVVGVGLNVNQTHFANEPNATSMAMETGLEFSVADVFVRLRAMLNAQLNLLEMGHFDVINMLYRDALYGRNQWLDFSTAERSFKGRIDHVDDQGFILIRSKQGQAQLYSLSQIKINY